MAPACDPSTREVEAEDSEFKVSLDTQQDFVLKTTKQNKTKNRCILQRSEQMAFLGGRAQKPD
jgi:hypothetical protein